MQHKEQTYIVVMVACVALVAVVGLILSIDPSSSSDSGTPQNIGGAAALQPQEPASERVPAPPAIEVRDAASADAKKDCVVGAVCTDPTTSTFHDEYCHAVVSDCQYGCDSTTGRCRG